MGFIFIISFISHEFHSEHYLVLERTKTQVMKIILISIMNSLDTYKKVFIVEIGTSGFVARKDHNFQSSI